MRRQSDRVCLRRSRNYRLYLLLPPLPSSPDRLPAYPYRSNQADPMEELLVLTACLYQKGCSESASTLYSQRPAFREFVYKTERRVKEAAGPIATNYVAPMVIFASGATGVMRVSESVGIKGRKDYIELFFKKEF